jgi:hypothetical protein
MMSADSDRISLKAIFIGLLAGAVISVLFLVTGNPGLIGVGAAIGASLAAVLHERARI